MADDFYPFVENALPPDDADIAKPPTPARIAVYDDMVMPPRVVMIEPTDVRSFLAEITRTVYDLAIQFCDTWSFQVIRELVENLIHASFMEPTISILDRGKTIVFCDQGPGIPNKQAALKPSFSSATSSMKRYIRGVGSGLPIVEEWLRLHHGTMTIEDNLGRGTTITVSLLEKDAPSQTRNAQNGSVTVVDRPFPMGGQPGWGNSFGPYFAPQNSGYQQPYGGYQQPYGQPPYGGYQQPYYGQPPAGQYYQQPPYPQNACDAAPYGQMGYQQNFQRDAMPYGQAGYQQPRPQGSYPYPSGNPEPRQPQYGQSADRVPQGGAGGHAETGSMQRISPTTWISNGPRETPSGNVQQHDNVSRETSVADRQPAMAASADMARENSRIAGRGQEPAASEAPREPADPPSRSKRKQPSGIDAHAPLTREQRDVLKLYAHLDKIGPKELGEQLGIASATGSRKLKEISAAGYIVKKGQKYVLTGEGQRMLTFLMDSEG